MSLEAAYLSVYVVIFLTIWTVVSGQLLFPMAIDVQRLVNVAPISFHRSHTAHMRIDRVRCLPGYRDPRVNYDSFYDLLVKLVRFIADLGISACAIFASAVVEPALVFVCSPDTRQDGSSSTYDDQDGPDQSPDDQPESEHNCDDCGEKDVDDPSMSDPYPPICVSYGFALRLRGGRNSDESGDNDSDSEEFESATAGSSSKRKRKSLPTKSRKSKGKGKAHAEPDSDPEGAIQVTVGKGRSKGMFVNEVIELDSALEYWNVPPSDYPIAYVVDLNDSPECLEALDKTLTVDAFLKKQCQDSLSGPTGSRVADKLAEVLILEEDASVFCRRSNLSCGGSFSCSFAAPDHLVGFERWDDETMDDLISAPIRAAKMAEAGSLLALATEFYESVISKHCKSKGEDNSFECGGHAVMRRFVQGRNNGKTHFIGCSNWSKGDGLVHRFTKIPGGVRESILGQIFRGETVDVEDDDVVSARTHFRDGKHVRGKLSKNPCPAQILILIPIDGNDLRAVVMPKAGTPHNHPIFPRTKVPFAVASQYKKCIESTGPIGATTLRVDKSSSTRAILGGKLPQELHPSLISNRRRRDMVRGSQLSRFPNGTGMQGANLVSSVWNEFEEDKSRAPADRYIHAVSTLADDTHVIITVNPDLAALTLDASWIMVDTTFVVVHGKTNEWKLLIWLNGLDRRTVIGRVWSNRATREAFVLVWNGIFEAIETITGKALNFKVFSKSSSLLGALGDSEGAQAQALGDVIILRRLNLPEVDGMATVDVDTILMFVWKTCLVHFIRGVLALESHLDDYNLFQYLLSFPYLDSDVEITEYYTVCGTSLNPKLKAWWAHKLSYPWLLPSLNRRLSKISNKFWDLTPRDTNPIEGSHAQDNQVNNTNHSLIEAILLAHQFDSDNARVIKASVEFGIWENGNNSARARFSSQAARQARARAKNAETATAEGGSRGLKARLAAAEQLTHSKDVEIQRLRSQLNSRNLTVPIPTKDSDVGPSTPQCKGAFSPTFIDISHSPKSDIAPSSSSPIAGPSKLPDLLFSGLLGVQPLFLPDSDLDYVDALRSDRMNNVFEEMGCYAVDGDDEVLASDPRPCSP
ncbi:hypothetical protein DFH07DRAFT_766393 [Mycena maculata]|uniref:Uncharacterized protein n=1 Tax=Mycena maculata TaxID=230809 RepID=A0AAD7NWA7_9AGAR|nr:hypothetical protein DFH07DRAFT_766393 [Mycena maculata]